MIMNIYIVENQDNATDGVPGRLPQNVPLWHYFKLKTIKVQQIHEKLLTSPLIS